MGILSDVGWKSPVGKASDVFPWHITNIERIMKQATAPNVTGETQLWCVKVILRCAETAQPQEKAELLQVPQLAPTLRYLLTQATRTALGARLRQLVFSVYIYILGENMALDEKLIMDVDTVRALGDALCDNTFQDLFIAAVLVARRISELPHVSSILVFEEIIFNALQDLLELRQVMPRVKMHVLHLFVNLCRHPKLHFRLARSQRVVFFAIDTILCVTNAKVVRRASRKVRHAMKGLLASRGGDDGKSAKQKCVDYSADFPSVFRHALAHMSAAVPCAMIIANLLSFSENRAFMVLNFSDLDCALRLCESQAVSIRLCEVARCAMNYLGKNVPCFDRTALTHLGPAYDEVQLIGSL